MLDLRPRAFLSSQMKTRWCSLLLAFTLLPAPAHAWDQKGHRVVAAIAWDHMDASTRTKATAILRGAPADSALLDADNTLGLTQAERDRQLFLRAVTWPDIVRDTGHPARRKKYHHSTWHYVNIFWQERGRKPYERRDLKVTGDLITRLSERASVLGNTAAPAAQRAIALAWFEHLAGDVHQPLHVTARITGFEQKGDQGGNGFCLGKGHPVGAHECSANLQALWDDLLTTRSSDESVDAIAASLQQQHGKPFFIGLGKYDGWASGSYKLAITKVYPVTLFRRTKPTDAYFAMALTEAEPRLALAGYRLGESLNALLR
jgi:hypothetical protein